MTTDKRAENLAQLIKRIRETYDVSESQIARRIGVAPSTVNSWTQGKRAGKRGPHVDTLRRLAAEFPKFTEAEIFEAAKRETPGRLTPDAEERILRLYRGLTEEQQRMTEIQLRALNEANLQ